MQTFQEWLDEARVMILPIKKIEKMGMLDKLPPEAEHGAYLDADKFDFKPMKEEMSFKEQLVHIGENIYWLSSNYIKEEKNPIKTIKNRASEMNKEQVLEFVASAYENALKAMKELDEKTLSKEFNWSGGKMNKFQFLNLIQDHQSHHVGQLIVYLRLNGIAPPKYIGW